MVSVIIPCHNAQAWLEACLTSVLNQTEEDLQIILIDDGSEDRTLSICERFASKDRRILLASQEHGGVSAARNRGLSLSEGEYLLFVDADDLLPPLAVASLLNAMKEDTDLVIGSHEEFRRGYCKTIRRESGIYPQSQCRESFAWFDAMLSTLWGKLYRRQVILERHLAFEASLPYCEDHVFNLQFCKWIRSAAVTGEPVYRYRLGGVASSLQYHANMGQHLLALLLAYQDFFDGQAPECFWQEKVDAHLTGSILHELTHNSREAAIVKTEEILTLYSPWLPCEQSPEAVLSRIYREKGLWIAGKKIKIALWRRFQRRI